MMTKMKTRKNGIARIAGTITQITRICALSAAMNARARLRIRWMTTLLPQRRRLLLHDVGNNFPIHTLFLLVTASKT